MIVVDAFQMRDADTGLFLTHGWIQRIEVDPFPRPVTKWDWVWTEDQLTAEAWGSVSVDRFIDRPDTRPRALDEKRLEKVPAPRCGCCGQFRYERVPGAYGVDRKPAMRSFVDGDIVHWRCEKHVGRNPCCIPGCGKTFAHKGDDWYGGTIMCGRCWRKAPKWMRDRVARVRKAARSKKAIRMGQDDRLWRVYSYLWERCRRAIIRGQSAPAFDEVTATSSGEPPPATLLKELETLGL